MKTRHVLFTIFVSFFLAPPMSASAGSAPDTGIVCIQGKVVDCAAGNCGKIMDKSQDCDLEALEKGLKKTKSALSEIKADLDKLKGSSLGTSKEVEVLRSAIGQLQGLLVSREDISLLVETKLQLLAGETESARQALVDLVTEGLIENQARFSTLEEWRTEVDRRFARTQLGVGGMALLGLDGMYYGAGATIYLPVGSEGAWVVAGGGFVGGSSVFGSSGFGYGANLSATHMVAGNSNWDLSIGPAAVAAFDAGSEDVGFRAFTAGGGLEAQFTSGWAKMSITPFIGAGGVKDGKTGGDTTFTGGALLRMEITPF